MPTDPNRISKPAIKAKTLIPFEHATSLKLLKAADTYQQIFIKYPKCGIFHSYAELLHAAILESDPNVEAFIPQPFHFRVGSTPYIPDCYLVKNGHRIVRELRSNGTFPDDWKEALQEFLNQHKINFEVINNDEIYAKEIEALNWLQITQTLVSARGQDTSKLENDVRSEIASAGSLTLIEIISETDDFLQFSKLLTLYRLLHKGQVTANLSVDPLHYSTEFRYVAIVA